MRERSRVRTVWAVVTVVLAVVTGFAVVAGLVITSGTSGECSPGDGECEMAVAFVRLWVWALAVVAASLTTTAAVVWRTRR